MAGRQADLVVLSVEDRTFLEAQVRRHKAPRSPSDRCRMVLLCAEGRARKLPNVLVPADRRREHASRLVRKQRLDNSLLEICQFISAHADPESEPGC